MDFEHERYFAHDLYKIKSGFFARDLQMDDSCL